MVKYYPDQEERHRTGYAEPLDAVVIAHDGFRANLFVGGDLVTNVPIDQRGPDSPTEFDPVTHWCERPVG